MPHRSDSIDTIERKTQNDPAFTPAEKDTIREIIRVYRGWQFVIKVLKGFTVVLGAIAATLVAIKTITGIM